MADLRDAVAGALRTVPEETFLRWSVGAIDKQDADAILDDPAVRAALVNAVEEGVHDYWRPTKARVPCLRCRDEAEAIVTRMVEPTLS